jgi:hypothetical protein
VLLDTKLDPGVPAEKQNGSIVTSTILTVDDEGYAMPGSTAFKNAVDAAMVSGSKLCAEQIRSRKP